VQVLGIVVPLLCPAAGNRRSGYMMIAATETDTPAATAESVYDTSTVDNYGYLRSARYHLVTSSRPLLIR